MRTIHFHGALADQFGPSIKLDVSSVQESVVALCTVLTGFREMFQKGAWHVVVGRTLETGIDLDESQIEGLKIGTRDIHYVPALVGAKSSTMKIVMGVALVGLSWGFAGAGSVLGSQISGSVFGSLTYGQALGSIGFAMAVGGASQLLSPEAEAEATSYLMSGPQMTGKEGDIVPIPYGRVITGGIPISGQLDIEPMSI